MSTAVTVHFVLCEAIQNLLKDLPFVYAARVNLAKYCSTKTKQKQMTQSFQVCNASQTHVSTQL